MKKMKNTIKEFKSYCSDEVANLVRPVINQMGVTWKEARETLKNVSNSYYGAADGFAGFIYYTDTIKFWRKNRAKILALCNYYAEDIGDGGAVDLVASFNCLKGKYNYDQIGRALYGNYNSDLDYIYNALAWFALEEVAYAYDNYINQ